nr:E3 ubiquitin-protein ligase TRIM38 isoform X4 [Nerophis lumbriciformis]
MSPLTFGLVLCCTLTGMYRNHTNNLCNRGLLCEYKDKLVRAIKSIQYEVEECRDAETKTYVQSVEIESQFDGLEREIRAEFGNLHRFLMEEECRDLERLKRQRGKLLKQLKDREKKISAQRKDLEKAIMVLNNKLAEDEGPKMLKDIQDLLKRLESPTVLSCLRSDSSLQQRWTWRCIQDTSWGRYSTEYGSTCKAASTQILHL